ncbi:MAG: hypothetical protein ACD_79C01209G0002 [uncultured bacterium]|nr:MAG: hypothetical protein ACD_79C01209G0002 [uncultured bacterium]
MRIINIVKKYDSKIYVIDETKIIFKLDCTCKDFIHRKLKKIGEFSNIKYYATPCKHLKTFIEKLEIQGYKLKVPKEMIGETKLTSKLKELLIQRANNQCECGCGGIYNLQIHRKTRGIHGGKYNMDNCIVLTRECHIMRHANEFSNKKSK